MRTILSLLSGLGLLLVVAATTLSAPADGIRASSSVPAFTSLDEVRSPVTGIVALGAKVPRDDPVILRVEKANRLVLERSLSAGRSDEMVDMGVIPVAQGDVLTLKTSAIERGRGELLIRLLSDADLRRDTALSLRNDRMLVFRDDFDSATLSAQTSVWSTTNRQGGRVHPSSPDNVYSDRAFSDRVGAGGALDPYSLGKGILTIRAGKIPTERLVAVRSALGSKAPTHLTGPDSLRYFSGDLESHATWSQTYGYFEMRARLPRGEGFWPAFWLTSTRSWPPEIDMLEAVYHADNDAGVNQMHSALHYKRISPSGQALGQQISAAIDAPVGLWKADLYDEFHLYSASWSAEWINIYFDERLVYRMATPAQIHAPMQLMVNLQLGKATSRGGRWAADFVDDRNLTNTMQIDYVAAYLDAQAFPRVQPAGPAGAVSAPGALGLAIGAALIGDTRNNLIVTGPGLDIIRTGGGADTILVRAGKDLHKIVEDFNPRSGTQIDLSGFGFRTPAEVMTRTRQIGPDLWIVLGRPPQPPQTIILRNMNLERLSPAMFRLNASPARGRPSK